MKKITLVLVLTGLAFSQASFAATTPSAQDCPAPARIIKVNYGVTPNYHLVATPNFKSSCMASQATQCASGDSFPSTLDIVDYNSAALDFTKTVYLPVSKRLRCVYAMKSINPISGATHILNIALIGTPSTN